MPHNLCHAISGTDRLNLNQASELAESVRNGNGIKKIRIGRDGSLTMEEIEKSHVESSTVQRSPVFANECDSYLMQNHYERREIRLACKPTIFFSSRETRQISPSATAFSPICSPSTTSVAVHLIRLLFCAQQLSLCELVLVCNSPIERHLRSAGR